MAILPQGQNYTRTFKMIDKYDHFSLRTSAGPVVNISKAGGAFAVAAGTNVDIGNGWYKVLLTNVDTGTIGDLAFYITGTNSDDTDFVDQVAPFIHVFGGTVGSVIGAVGSVTGGVTVTTNNDKINYYILGGTLGKVSHVLGGTIGSITGAITVTTNSDKIGYSIIGGTVGKVTFPVTMGTSLDKTGYSLVAGQLFVKKNTALAGFSFPMTDKTDHVTLITGETVTGTVSIDGGAFGALTNSPVEIGTTGIYKVDLAAADLNGAVIMLKFTSTGADTRLIEIITQA